MFHILGQKTSLITKEQEIEYLIRMKEGDPVAFEKIYRKYAKQVYYFACRYVSESNAEEVVQEIFTRIWEHRQNVDPEMSFSNYLFKSTKNIIFNLHRKLVNHQAYCNYLLNYLKSYRTDMEKNLIFKDILDKINQIIAKLPPKRKEIFQLCRIDGYSYKEVAVKLNISEKTIETHMRLAIKDIKELVSQQITDLS